MKALNILYENYEQLQKEILAEEFNEQDGLFVRIHVSNSDKIAAVELAKKVREVLPTAKIIGCSTSGVIYDGEIYEDGVLISILQFESVEITSSVFEIEKQGETDFAKNKIMADMSNKDVSIAFMFFSDQSLQVGDLLADISGNYEDITLLGGVSGFIKGDDIYSFVFDEDKYIENGAATCYIENRYVLAYANVVTGHDAISDVHKITKVDKNIIKEIDNQDAKEWVKKNLGISGFKPNLTIEEIAKVDELINYPFMPENYGESGRFVRYDSKADNISHLGAGFFKDGDEFRVGYFNILKSVEEWQVVCADLQKISAQCLFVYDCILRRTYLNDLAKWELGLFKNCGISGAFLLGEIGQKSSKPYFYHGACSLFTFAQEEEYLDINISNFENLSKLYEEQSEHIEKIIENKEGSKLPLIVAEIEKRYKKRYLAESSTDIKTMVDYLKVEKDNESNNVCLIDIKPVNSEVDAGRFFEKIYETVLGIVKENTKKESVHFYAFDDKSFFFVMDKQTKKETLLEISSLMLAELKSTFNYAWSSNIVINIAVATQEMNISDLVEQAERTKFKSFEEEIIICDNYQTDAENIQKEFEIVALLKEIIKINSVEPYFQGIYDNRNNRFYCYEALMRLKTPEGKILFPGEFMEISKKYNLYRELSLCMVLKVLEIFEKRDEIVTVNISMLDILSKEFETKIFNKLESMKNAKNIVFELVETEQFDDRDALQKYIRRAKNCGSRIAVDDFGSGYSNFIEIGNLDIDFIKLNGSLTELLGTDTSYDNILESISYMGKKMQVELIAECVETSAMQRKIVSSGIRFSQGYLFSKPMPIEVFDEVSRKNPKETKKNSSSLGKSEAEQFFGNSSKLKKEKLVMGLGGVIATTLAIILIFFFAINNNVRVQEMNDTFLEELATSMTDKVSAKMNDAKALLLTFEATMTSEMQTEQDKLMMLRESQNIDNFDNTYISFDGVTAIDGNGNLLDADISEVYDIGKEGEVTVLSPMIEKSTGREFFMITTPLYQQGEKTAQLYGLYYTDEFSSVLDLKVFGGEAFFHICEVNGTPIVISGSSNNLFKGENMYSFIDSLDMRNEHTSKSVQVDMENGETVLLKYAAGNTERTAVMLPIPDTDWCLVSIVLDSVTNTMANSINVNTVLFALIVIAIFGVYIFVTVIIHSRNNKGLIKALESSYSLANSLQASIETDALTRTYSRAAATEKIAEAIKRRKGKKRTQALLILDIDNFNMINDKYGFEAGDLCLQEFVGAIKSRLRNGDIMGRLGGDEFVVLLENLKDKRQAKELIQKIFTSAANVKIQNLEFEKISISVGAYILPETANEYEEANARANKALLEAKITGKNKFVIFKSNKKNEEEEV